MHYGLEIFEGMKAFSGEEKSVCIFRAHDHFKRMNISANRLTMPSLDIDDLVEGLKALLSIERDWVPQNPGTALYIRPTMLATERTLALRPSKNFIFYILLSPVGALYDVSKKPASVYASTTYTRASVGGVGNIKTGGNYAASMLAQQEALQKGFSQVLWLDPCERKYVEEVGSMNIFFVINNTLVTPSLSGTILAGITRDSIIQIAKNHNIVVEERRISIEEVLDSMRDSSCTEIFGTGTAAAITPIDTIGYNNEQVTVKKTSSDRLAQHLYAQLNNIQTGKDSEYSDWVTRIM